MHWQQKYSHYSAFLENNKIADALSRVTPQDIQDSSLETPILAVTMLPNSSIKAEEREMVRKETKSVLELPALKKLISNVKKKSLQKIWNFT